MEPVTSQVTETVFGLPGLLIYLVTLVFQVWMLVDAIRRGEYLWALFLLIGSVISTVLYYFLVYRDRAGGATRGFELPGAADRRRIRELRDQIHHLDKPHHHLQLGDIYFQQGRLALAEASYRAALERDGEDADIRAHLGQCLLRQGRAAEARPLLEGVVAADPRHDYGHTLMALAEALTALGEGAGAVRRWRQVLEHHSYARARTQLGELLLARGEREAGFAELREVVADDAHAPAFQRRRDRVWVRRAKRLLRAG